MLVRRGRPLLFAALLLAPAARADDAIPPEGTRRPAEVYRYTRHMDFRNEPVGNRFVVAEEGTTVAHGVHDWGLRSRAVLHEVRPEERRLEAVELNGQEVPVDFVRAQAPGLFSATPARLDLERFSVGRDEWSAVAAIERVLAAQYADDVILSALARFCERDWRRIRSLAAGEDRIVWDVPALYAVLGCAVTPVAGRPGLLRVVVEGSGRGPEGGTGAREVEDFRFEGLYDEASSRFEEIAWSGTVVVERPVGERASYYAGLAELAAAVAAAEAGDHDRAVARFEACRDEPGLSALADSCEDYFGRVRDKAEGVAWGEDLAAARRRAQASGRPLLLLFDQENCPPCLVLHRTVIEAPEFVEAVEEGFVPVHLDFCREPALVERYGLRGTPTLLVLDPTGEVLAERAGVMGLQDALALLREAAGAPDQE